MQIRCTVCVTGKVDANYVFKKMVIEAFLRDLRIEAFLRDLRHSATVCLRNEVKYSIHYPQL